jgi:hypothetical protein
VKRSGKELYIKIKLEYCRTEEQEDGMGTENN